MNWHLCFAWQLGSHGRCGQLLNQHGLACPSNRGPFSHHPPPESCPRLQSQGGRRAHRQALPPRPPPASLPPCRQIRHRGGTCVRGSAYQRAARVCPDQAAAAVKPSSPTHPPEAQRKHLGHRRVAHARQWHLKRVLLEDLLGVCRRGEPRPIGTLQHITQCTPHHLLTWQTWAQSCQCNHVGQAVCRMLDRAPDQQPPRYPRMHAVWCEGRH